MRTLHVVRLSDEFGDYDLRATCTGCNHVRVIAPAQLARIFGWKTKLETVAARMRCSKCNKRSCELAAIPKGRMRGGPDPRNE